MSFASFDGFEVVGGSPLAKVAAHESLANLNTGISQAGSHVANVLPTMGNGRSR